jgi:hypothetical protein
MSPTAPSQVAPWQIRPNARLRFQPNGRETPGRAHQFTLASLLLEGRQHSSAEWKWIRLSLVIVFSEPKSRQANLEQATTIMRAIALYVILAFSGCIIAAGFMTAPATAGKMDGKPSGKGLAHYEPAKNTMTNGQPSAKTKKPPAN